MRAVSLTLRLSLDRAASLASSSTATLGAVRWGQVGARWPLVIAAPELWKHSAFRPHLIDVGWGGTWLSASARNNAVHELQLLHFYRHIGRRAAIQDALGSCPADWSGIRHQAATSVLERLLQMKPRLGHMRVTRWPKNTRDLCHRPLPFQRSPCVCRNPRGRRTAWLAQLPPCSDFPPPGPAPAAFSWLRRTTPALLASSKPKFPAQL